MNIAVIIGIDKYNNAENLKASKNDADLLYEIINSTGKYSKIEKISGEYNHDEVLEKINGICNVEESIEEIFFYFSGHGYIEDDFYYCTTDTDCDNINSTSIVGSQLDEFFRSLNPNLLVKVIDACHSGKKYIKEFREYKAKELNDCVFMFSCMDNQSSYADNQISCFTKSFIESLMKYKDNEQIKYTDVANYISDIFKNNQKQSPYFNVQSKWLDSFIEPNDDFREALTKIKYNLEECEKEEDFTNTEEIVANIEEKLKHLPTDKEVEDFMKKLNFEITKREAYLDILGNDRYEVSSENIDDTDKIPNKGEISDWLYTNRERLKVFARAKNDTVQGRMYYTLSKIQTLYGGKAEEVDFEVTENDYPFCIRVTLNPTKLPLPQYSLYIVILQSFFKAYIFTSYVEETLKNRKEYMFNSSSNWELKEFIFKDDIENIESYLTKNIDDFKQYCIDSLEKYLKNI